MEIRPQLTRPGAGVVIWVLVWILALAMPVSASSDTSVRWSSLSESSTCTKPYIGTPIMSKSGVLSYNEPLLGPFGTYFGRTLAEVRSELVSWTVPYSGGIDVNVNRAALPAFNQVAANLAIEAADGRIYPVTVASAHTGRTIGGSRQLSRHALGIAIDINPAANPYRDDPDQLITNMPSWYVEAWEAAGFCWGGSWRFSKDPMHFSWIGPTVGGLEIRPPSGEERPFETSAFYPTPFGDGIAESPSTLADVAGFGPLDVVRARPIEAGTVVDVSGARAGFGQCSLFRFLVPTDLAPTDRLVIGDIDGDSRSDVVLARQGDGTVSLRTALHADAFETVATTEVGSQISDWAIADWAIADWDGDQRGDLWVFDSSGAVRVLGGPTFVAELDFSQVQTPPSSTRRYAVADRDGDGEVEVFVFDPGLDQTVVSVFGRTGSTWLLESTAAVSVDDPVAFAAADEDGDGRADIAVLNGTGAMVVAIGNTSTGRPIDGWWSDPGYECGDEVLKAEWRGRFMDDDESIFEGDIERIADAEITRGCNPPFEDAFCPESPVSRGQMAAFLVRALGLPAVAGLETFSDDDASIFQTDIESLAAAGVTRGCGPAAFCPDRAVTRGEMAAFLVRALALPVTDVSGLGRFADDDHSIFEEDIEALETAGITRGCGQPDELRFCPDDQVTRGEMAAFLTRALL